MNFSRYYTEHPKQLRISIILIVWMIQGFIINHYFNETNHGKNDSETDAVILFSATAFLFICSLLMFFVTFYFEKKIVWRWIYAVLIFLIPIIWIVLILETGNPLYFFAK
jgi:cell division protein FtsW (lipid II flippase)